jgi:CBS domain-containing protein
MTEEPQIEAFSPSPASLAGKTMDGALATASGRTANASAGRSNNHKTISSGARNSPESILSLVAGDIMSSPAVVARTTDTVSSVARLLLEAGVSGVPVLDAGGRAVGMVSDGDLFPREGDDRRAVWLELLATQPPPGSLSKGFLDRPVTEVMSSPLITISPKASAREIAEAFRAHRIKRLPVLKGEELVGVVGRADLLCLVDGLPSAPAVRSQKGGGLLEFLESLIGGAPLRGDLERSAAPAHALHGGTDQAERGASTHALSAQAFRDAARARKAETVDQREAIKREAELQRQRQVKELLEQQVSDKDWSELLQKAELAAANGEQEVMMVRFPSDLCSDGGRKVDVAEEGWEGTLRGKPADLFSRWRTELKPQGFGLGARIVSYDDGIIGDIGLYLTWGGE